MADRLVNVVRQGVTTRYVYNGDGQRRLKEHLGVITRYIYDSPSGTPRLLQDSSRRYVYGPGGVAYTTSAGGETVLNVFHTDAQGSVRALTNAAAQLVYVSRFDPYGLPRAVSGSAASGQPLGYTGMQYDPEVELVNLNARLYAPGLGRFMQRDTVMGDTGNPTSLNRCTYAHSNPMVFQDPSGHRAWPQLGIYDHHHDLAQRPPCGPLWPSCLLRVQGIWNTILRLDDGLYAFTPAQEDYGRLLLASALYMHSLTRRGTYGTTAMGLIQYPNGDWNIMVGYTGQNPTQAQQGVAKANRWEWAHSTGIPRRDHAELNILAELEWRNLWEPGHRLIAIASSPIAVCLRFCQPAIYDMFPDAYIVNPQLRATGNRP